MKTRRIPLDEKQMFCDKHEFYRFRCKHCGISEWKYSAQHGYWPKGHDPLDRGLKDQISEFPNRPGKR